MNKSYKGYVKSHSETPITSVPDILAVYGKKKITKELLVNAQWVCYDCGIKYGRRKPGVATWHTDICDVCGEEKTVTEQRDFGYLRLV